ncbi:hypothetical protein [Streptomyces sp. NPDC003877]
MVARSPPFERGGVDRQVPPSDADDQRGLNFERHPVERPSSSRLLNHASGSSFATRRTSATEGSSVYTQTSECSDRPNSMRRRAVLRASAGSGVRKTGKAMSFDMR